MESNNEILEEIRTELHNLDSDVDDIKNALEELKENIESKSTEK
jgi:hypothetical protein